MRIMNPLQQLNQPTGRFIHHNDRPYLFFGGTAYLSLLVEPNYIDIYKEGIDRYGLNNGTSRSNNIQLGIYAEAEANMAARFGFEEATLLSSGYLAAQLAVRQLQAKGEMIYAPGTHPALWLNGATTTDGQTFEDWAQHTVSYINRSTEKKFVVVANSMDNLRPAQYDFSAFREIDPQKKVYLLLDDSHGIGVREANRCFVDIGDMQDNMPIEVIVVASLAKGMGTDAGILLSSKEIASFFRQSPFFMGASPASPAAMYALVYGEAIYKEQVDKMQKNVTYMQQKVGEDINHIDRFPVFTVSKEGAFEKLLAKEILISSFPYPLPTDQPLNRIVVAAHHTENDMNVLAEALLSI